MTIRDAKTAAAKSAPKTQDQKLDDALEQTFPASDPPAMTDPNVRVGNRKEQSKVSGAPAPR
jgi:hypothetical protein